MQALRPYLAALLAAALLNACVAPRMDAPVNDNWQARRNVLAALHTWEFTGRIGVLDADESHSSRIRWRQDKDDYVINLWGTLNVGATELTGRPGAVVLEQAGEPPLRARSAEGLIYEQLGYELPVTQLSYWIKGIPAPGSQAQTDFNAEHHLVALQQDGWSVQYMAYTNYGAESLPTRIRIEKPPLRLDFVRLDWTLAP